MPDPSDATVHPVCGPETVLELAARVREPNAAVPGAVRDHLDRLTKPRGSLGRLETVAVRLARILGDPPRPLQNRTVFVLAGDHGVAARGVSAYPSEVTVQMCSNLGSGGAAVCVLARETRCDVVVADLGVNRSGPVAAGVLDLRVRAGTRDLADGPAMTTGEAATAVMRGASLIRARDPLPDVICLGEMGIGNSTSAAALTALLVECPVDEAVGPGTGVSGRGLEAKRAAVRAAMERVVTMDSGAAATASSGARSPSGRPYALEALRQVGGLEIAGLVGLTLEAASRGIPIVVDGFIATAAALTAARLAPPATAFMFAAHQSPEPGHRHLLKALCLEPLLDLGLRLGEGTGAVLALPLLDAAGAVLRHMATFESAGISGPVT